MRHYGYWDTVFYGLKTAALVGFASCAIACGGAQTPPVGVPRSTARAAVDVAKDAWVSVATVCVSAAETLGEDAIRQKCVGPMETSRILILAAAEAVDTQWSPHAGCDLRQGIALAGAAAKTIPGLPVDTQVIIDDAMKLASELYVDSACAVDGGGDAE